MQSSGGSWNNKGVIPALLNQYRGNIQQTEKSSLSAMHTTSQCFALLLAEKKIFFCLITLSINRSLAYSHFNSHIFPFTQSTNSTGGARERKKIKKLSPFPTVNISLENM